MGLRKTAWRRFLDEERDKDRQKEESTNEHPERLAPLTW
jgi:hypothetical protein